MMIDEGSISPADAGLVGAGDAALVRGDAGDRDARANSRTASQQLHGLGRTAVTSQRPNLRIAIDDIRDGGAAQTARGRIVGDEVVVAAGEIGAAAGVP